MAVRVEMVAHPRRKFAVWRWSALGVAALAMAATLPGRTHGLGLITEDLLKEWGLTDPAGRVSFGAMNTWATLIGALFCVPAGWLIDRFGARAVLPGVMLALGATVLAMTRLAPGGPAVEVTGRVFVLDLFLLILLTRGLGQSALSVASLGLMAQAARRDTRAIGFYSLLVAVLFAVPYKFIMFAEERWVVPWQLLWAEIGCFLLVAAPVCWLLARPGKVDDTAQATNSAEGSYTLGRALATPAFWVFGLATSFYGLIASATSLWNQSILAEREFGREVFLEVASWTFLFGLAGNFLTGFFATRIPLHRLLALAMFLVGSALATFPFVRTITHVYLYAGGLGFGGGMITMLFFACWRRAYGPAHVGTIQGAAQLLTVLASAFGPEILALGRAAAGSYGSTFQALAAVCGLFALAAWFTPLPRPLPGETPHDPDAAGRAAEPA